MRDTAAVFLGSCLCGAVRYEVSCAVERASHCHCGMCRKNHEVARDPLPQSEGDSA